MLQKIPAFPFFEFAIGPLPIQKLADRIGQLLAADAAAGGDHLVNQGELFRGELPAAKLLTP
jgi:hypothetical protein